MSPTPSFAGRPGSLDAGELTQLSRLVGEQVELVPEEEVKARAAGPAAEPVGQLLDALEYALDVPACVVGQTQGDDGAGRRAGPRGMGQPLLVEEEFAL